MHEVHVSERKKSDSNFLKVMPSLNLILATGPAVELSAGDRSYLTGGNWQK